MAKKRKVGKSKKVALRKRMTGKPSVGRKPTPKKRTAPVKSVSVKTGERARRAAPAARKGKKFAASAPGQKLSAGEKKRFLNLLIRLRAHIAGQIDFLTTDNLNRTQNDNELYFRSEEQGTDNFDRDMALSRVSMEQNAVFEIDEALHRIQRGSYGACETCGKRIEKARLAAIPYSRLCVSCQSATESGAKRTRPSEAALFRDADAGSKNQEAEEEE